MKTGSLDSGAAFRQVVCIVLDGVGVGEAPDAGAWGDEGSNSLANTAKHVGSLRLPVLGRLGLGNIVSIEGVPAEGAPSAFFGKMTPASAGKDSTSGHWELMGCVVPRAFPSYPSGFPKEIVEEFERRIGRKVIGNRPASGTAIIEELGQTHLSTGRPILYTSQDSVFQLAAHESVIAREELYRMCAVARSLLSGAHGVARVIARPFAGTSPGFFRTAGRKDFSLPPPIPTVLDGLRDAGVPVLAIGKIHDLFCGRGVSRHVPTTSNREGIEATLDAVVRAEKSFVFTNLIDFDMMWGHRNDARAYALGLEEFDSHLRVLLDRMDAGTLLIITSDHGNDPTTASTDHSREFVPLLVYHRGLDGIGGERNLGTRNSFGDVGRTIAENFGLKDAFPGKSFLSDILGRHGGTTSGKLE
jgi:phosphopentomutase